MTLLEEIQVETVDPKSDIGALLRKCKLLAARLNNRPLEDWLHWESNGYPVEVDVPPYRTWRLELTGTFWGPMGAEIANVPIPLAVLPDKDRPYYSGYKCRQSIATIDGLLKKGTKGGFQVSVGDLAITLGTKVYNGYNCIQVRADVNIANLLEISNAVRNRILDFVLAIWKEAPDAGEINSRATPKIEDGKVTQIFNTTILGGTANIIANASNTQITIPVIYNDFKSLATVLREKGVQENDITELEHSIKQDGPIHEKKEFGPRVKCWIGKMLDKAAAGAWKIGESLAEAMLRSYLSTYYGLGS